MTTLTVSDFSFSYNNPEQPELAHINWTPTPGSFNLLIGPSGSGKSTLLKAMAGLLPHFGGQILTGEIRLDDYIVDTVMPFERAKRIAMLFQNPNRQFAMPTPAEQITFALENIQLPASEITDRVTTSLDALNITGLANQKIITLSGGEKQKVALATVLALGSDYILLDEPFANVDPDARLELLQLLKQLQVQHQKTIILADHDLSGYTNLVDAIYQINPENHQLSQTDASVLIADAVGPHTFKTNAYQTLSPLKLIQVGLSVEKRTLLKPSDLQLPKAQLGLLSGANGTGKSTLFAAISHQTDYTGTIMWNTQDSQKFKIKQWAQRIGLIFQDAIDQFVDLTVAEELALSKKHTLLPDYWTEARIQSALTQLNLADFKNANLYQLSGGQQKKVQVLSMLMMGQPIFLLDEPLAGLDHVSVKSMLTLIKQTLTDNGLSALMISHQRNGLDDFIDYEWHLSNQKITQEVPE